MFPVRYELNSYINLLRNSVFKGLSLLRPETYRPFRIMSNSFYVSRLPACCKTSPPPLVIGEHGWLPNAGFPLVKASFAGFQRLAALPLRAACLDCRFGCYHLISLPVEQTGVDKICVRSVLVFY
jgi:hypothetical protein